MKDLKSFLSVDTLIALFMCFVMWIVYYFTDFKLSAEVQTNMDTYVNKGVIYLTLLASCFGGMYFVNKLTYSTLETVPRLVIIALFIGVGGYLLWVVGSPHKNFLASDVSLLAIFSGINLFLLLIFGWQEPKEVADARVLNAEPVAVEKAA